MDGILIIDKPKGMTSHDVVDFVRKSFGIKKAGHAGTLDPMATGVLVLLIGRGTKSSNRFMSGDKEYEAALVLGAVSDTGDAWGTVSDRGGIGRVTEEDVRRVFDRFIGEIEQHPPMYSAVKIRGKKLYELARKGIIVKTEPKKVVVKKLDILKMRLPEVSFRAVCSKGTYIRQLAADIGESLGCGAYLSALTRTRSGDFGIAQALSVGDMRAFKRGDLEKRLIRL